MATTLNVGDIFVVQQTHRRLRTRLHRGYNKADDGIMWGQQRTSFIASSYSPEHLAELAYAETCEAVKHGDTVIIEGVEYTAKVLGNYSDCIIFNPV